MNISANILQPAAESYLHPAVEHLREQLNEAGIQLRFRCNKRRLLSVSAAKHGGRKLVVHPLLFANDQHSCANLIHEIIAQNNRQQVQALQKRVDATGNRLVHIERHRQGDALCCDLFGGVLTDKAGEDLAALECRLLADDRRLLINDNDTTLLGIEPKNLRVGGRRLKLWTLNMHLDFMAETSCFEDLALFAKRQGRGSFPKIDVAMQRCFDRIQRHILQCSQPEQLSATFTPDPVAAEDRVHDYPALLRDVHQRWFGHLPMVELRWSRDPGRRQLRSIRFGSYRRQPQPHISLHPRLQRPWVHSLFIEYLLYHELCHHVQACDPIPGEKPHSRRFRQLEAGYPRLQQALTWERQHLDAFLAPE